MSNVHFAHRIQTQGYDHQPPSTIWARWVGLSEAVALSIVAVATAWSGYQAARWDGLSTKEYADAILLTARSQENATLAGQDRLYDIVMFNAWASAKTGGKDKLAGLYERRFRPEFDAPFAAWLKLDPFKNPVAPPGPTFMPEYTNVHALESAKLADEAKSYFEGGVSKRQLGNNYVKVTVFLATVLLLTALSQRFEMLGARAAVIVVSFILLTISAYWLLTFPRA